MPASSRITGDPGSHSLRTARADMAPRDPSPFAPVYYRQMDGVSLYHSDLSTALESRCRAGATRSSLSGLLADLFSSADGTDRPHRNEGTAARHTPVLQRYGRLCRHLVEFLGDLPPRTARSGISARPPSASGRKPCIRFQPRCRTTIICFSKFREASIPQSSRPRSRPGACPSNDQFRHQNGRRRRTPLCTRGRSGDVELPLRDRRDGHPARPLYTGTAPASTRP